MRKFYKWVTLEYARRSAWNSCFIKFELESWEHVTFGLGLPLIGSFWASFPYHGKKDKEIGVSVHGGSVWFHVWVNPMECSKHKDGWRAAVWHVADWVRGKRKYSDECVEERKILVPMPEGAYPATAKLMDITISYKHWPSYRYRRCDIELERMIPCEGKGENSWDCGIDGTWSMSQPAKSIPEAVGGMVGHLLAQRIKRGGWSDWNWHEAHPDAQSEQLGGSLNA